MDTTITNNELPGDVQYEFNLAPWLVGIIALCLLPLVLMTLGVDLSSYPEVVTVQNIAHDHHSVSDVKEQAFRVDRGNFPHTILE